MEYPHIPGLITGIFFVLATSSSTTDWSFYIHTEVIYKVSMRLTKIEWSDDYKNQDSSIYKSLASQVTSAVGNIKNML